MNRSRGLVITYFGNGKGKTTAALGLALRASGYGRKVKIIQFVKGNWKTGEQAILKNLKTIELKTMGSGFINIRGDKETPAKHKSSAQAAMEQAKKDIKDKSLFVLVLDEILVAIYEGLISRKQVLDLISTKPKMLHLVLTGRPKIPEIIEKSDLVSEIREIKHPFNRGINAIDGIDY